MFNASAIGSRKERSLDAVKCKNLLGDRFVLRHENGMRAGAGVAQSQKVDVGDYVHFLGVIAVEGFGQIKDEIGIATRERMQGLGTTVEFEVGGLVTQLLQRLEDLL